jgi:hypothetical protein
MGDLEGPIALLSQFMVPFRTKMQDLRLLAVVVAKNAVGSNWAKQVRTREWQKIPEVEREYVRNILLTQILPHDPSDRVAVQACILISNIAQFDFPDRWPSLMESLLSMSKKDSLWQLPPEKRHRPLKALKYTVRILQRKRFVLEEPSGVPLMTLTPERLHALSANVEVSRSRMHAGVRQLIAPLEDLWSLEYESFARGDQFWACSMRICRLAMSVCFEALTTADSLQEVEQSFVGMMQRSCALAGRIVDQIFKSQREYVRQDEVEALSKCWERLLQIAIASLAKHTLLFAHSLPQWLDLCVNAGILIPDVEMIHRIRTKSRVLSIRLLARTFLHPYFRHTSSPWLPEIMSFRPQAANLSDNPALKNSIDFIDSLVSNESGKCAALVQCLASKYITVSPDEKLEWEADPEGFAREVDIETSPDADTPRPCGIGLLECMLEYSHDQVQQSIMSLAHSVAEDVSVADQSIMAREAVYRIVGECFSHMRGAISFNQWYANELRMIIQGTDPKLGMLSDFSRSILVSRAIWLVGVCSEDLDSASFSEVFALCTNKVSDPDLVVSLMAISSVGALLSQVIEEQQFVSQPEDTKLLLLEGHVQSSANGLDTVNQAGIEFKAHMDVVLSNVDTLLLRCFQMLPNLRELESMIRVLQCISGVIELIGEKVGSHFEAFATCIPSLWKMMAGVASPARNPISITRLQCSVLAMLSHLVSKLGRTASEDPRISQVIYPLLLSSTDPLNPAAEPLAEDALRLWLTMLQITPSLTSELKLLGPSRLVPHLEKGKDLEYCLQIASAYALHGGWESISGMLDLLASKCDLVLSNVVQYFTEGPNVSQNGGTNLASHVLSVSPQVSRELDSALSLLATLQRMHPDLPVSLESPIKTTCKLLCIDFRSLTKSSMPNASFIPGRLANLLHPALQIICRCLYCRPEALGALTDNDRNSQVRLFDRWVALGSAQDVGEVFIPSLSVMGRARRHNLAVSLCLLIMSDVSELTKDGPRVARMLVMALKAALEQRQFEKDQELLLQQMEEADHSQYQDILRERKLSMMRVDPLRTVDAQDATRAAAGHVCCWLGKDGLLKILEDYNPIFSAEMSRLLSSQLSEAEANEAISQLRKAHL